MIDASITRLRDAGVGLSADSIAWGRRPSTPPAIELTARDHALLSTLLDFGYLTTSMLGLLFWGRTSAAVNRRLKLLHDVGYVDKLRPRVRATNASREWIYRLSARGWRDVASRHPRWSNQTYTPADVQAISYLEHDVQVSAIVVHLAALAAQERQDDRSCGLLDRVPFELLGPRSGVVPVPGANGPGPTFYANQGRRGRTIAGTLAPDATLVGVDAAGQRTAVLIEYDRTRRAHKQVAKLRRYDQFLATWRASRYAALDLEPLVLFICASEQQLRPFLDAADRNLTTRSCSSDGASSHDEQPGREQIAFTTRERLLARDWRMLQVAPRTSEQRRIISVRLALPALFHRRPADDLPRAPEPGPWT